jgi:hypothetical protein
MISNFRRTIIFAGALLGGLAFIAGCKTSTPAPPFRADLVEPAPTLPPPPAVTNQLPIAISRPRPPEDASNNMAPNILAWDALTKVYQARSGETNAPFAFSLTNVSSERVLIYDTSTTCECTVAKLPARPWALAPGDVGQISATLDLHGRTDPVTNYVIVFTSKGNRLLTVKGIPANP